MTKRRDQVVALLREHGRLTTAQVAERLRVSADQAASILCWLRKRGVLFREKHDGVGSVFEYGLQDAEVKW